MEDDEDTTRKKWVKGKKRRQEDSDEDSSADSISEASDESFDESMVSIDRERQSYNNNLVHYAKLT